MKQVVLITIIIFLIIVLIIINNYKTSRACSGGSASKTTYLKSNGITSTFNVTNRGNRSYVFDNTDENKTINANRGDILVFNINALGHPFLIKTERSTGTRGSITENITNNGSETGTIRWDTSNVDVGIYYYNCQIHRSMGGEINIS
jgi:plastocyanin